MKKLGIMALSGAGVAILWAVLSAQVYQAPTSLVNSSGASTSATNVSTANTLYTYTVPAGLLQGNFQPLHLRLVGQLTTNPYSVGGVNVACSFGGTTASVMLLNTSTATPLWAAMVQGLTAAPVAWDVWVTGYGATQSNGIFESIMSRIKISSQATTNSITYASVTGAGTTALTSAQTLLCTWQWSSASATNSIIIYNATLSQGSS